MAKTAEPHPKLPGTVFTAAEEIEAAGGEALPIVGDIRDAEAVEAAAAQTAERFGGIDLVVNNASAINLAPMRELPVKRFDLMQQINARGTFVVTQACLPHLRESDHAHVLTLSPPLSVDPRWLAGHSAYTLSKMGMTMITLGVAADEAEAGIGANCLWPRTIIATAAVQNLLGGDEAMARARTPEILADAAHAILARDPRSTTGNTFIDDEVLAEAGHHRPRPATRPRRRRPRARHLRRRLAGGRARLTVVLLSGGTGGAKLARGLLDECDDLVVVANTGDDVGGARRARLARPRPRHLLAGRRDRRARLRAARGHLAGDGRARGRRAAGLVPARRPRPRDVPDPHRGAARGRAPDRGARRAWSTRWACARACCRWPTSRWPRGCGTAAALLPFQEYMIVHARGAAGGGRGARRGSSARGRPTPCWPRSREAELIVIGPSNPVISIGPILALPGMREALAGAPAPVVAVSPFVDGRSVKGPTRAFLRLGGHRARAPPASPAPTRT